jgi:hypothetical protein
MMALVVFVTYIPNRAFCVAFDLFIEVVDGITSRLLLTP